MTFDPGWTGVAEFLVTIAGFLVIVIVALFSALYLVGVMFHRG